MGQHIPVLMEEVLQLLAPSPGMVVLDGTLGLAGHAERLLQATAPHGQLYGFDRDARNLAQARQHLARFGDRVQIMNDSFGNIEAYDIVPDIALFDLGFSSTHVDEADRGFSFLREGRLDMRYDQRGELTAEAIVNSWSRDDLATIFRQLGEEPKAQLIAKAIVDARRVERIVTTTQLADIVSAVVPRRGKIHPATKVFQALRIAVNDELGEVEQGLTTLFGRLRPGARVAIITFHSLEDRLVKQLIKKDLTLKPLTKKPVLATRSEVLHNPRARSAKLRVVEKV